MRKTVTDFNLIQRTRSGDAAAFDEIVVRYQAQIFATAMRTCRSVSLSEDVCQETFVAAWKNIDTLVEPAKLSGWLCSIARNRSLDALRRRRREVLTEDGTVDDEDPATVDKPSPLTQTIDLQQRQNLLQALHSLPPKYRDPLILFYERGATARQIARSLELKVDAVKQRLHRGKILLRDASFRIAACASGAETSIRPPTEVSQDVLATLPW